MDATMFVEQLAELLEHLYLKRKEPTGSLDGLEPFTLMGWSMGGAISTEFALRYPAHVKRLVLVAPAGLPTNKPPTAHIIKIPLLCNVMMFFGAKLFYKNMCKEWAELEAPNLTTGGADTKAIFVNTFTYNRGFMRSLLKTLQQFNLDKMEEQFRLLGKHSRPVMLLWGDRDNTCPYANAAKLQEFLPRARLVTIEKGGHGIVLQRHDEVLAAIRKMLATDTPI